MFEKGRESRRPALLPLEMYHVDMEYTHHHWKMNQLDTTLCVREDKKQTHNKRLRMSKDGAEYKKKRKFDVQF